MNRRMKNVEITGNESFAQYKFIEIKPRAGKKNVWEIVSLNNKFARLGEIGWYPQWKQYIAIFHDTAIFSFDCLRDISDFIEQLNQK